MSQIEANVANLIEELQSNNAESAALSLIACGAASIEPLRDFLLLGKPSNVFQPRFLAVEILARLRAKEVLVEYLSSENDIADPAIRLGEETVKEKAARELASWKTDDVFEFLFDLIRNQPLAGFIEAISVFNRTEPIPCLIDALADDICRPAAEIALKDVFISACPLLIAAVSMPHPAPENESASSVRRRRSAAALLVAGGISVMDWPALAPLLNEEDHAILTAISRIGAEIGSTREKAKIATRLLNALPGVEWSLQDDVENVLVRCFHEGKSRIEEEILSHKASAEEKGGWDPVLQSLLRIRRKAEEKQGHDE